MVIRPVLAKAVGSAAPTCSPGVISDARGRQRRRLASVVAVAICAAAAAGLIVSQAQSPAPRPAAVSPAMRVAPAAVLAHAPSMGVACRARSCDWVGLAVWLRRPAVAVTATIAGRLLNLEVTNAYPRPGARATFVGYLRPVRLVTRLQLAVGSGPTTWDTNLGQWPMPAVRLRIRYGNGSILVTRLDIPLEPGWG
jgi:hypothetical protein